jgi:hypothetical protein
MAGDRHPRRIIERGAQPWRFGHEDYAEAVDHLRADRRLALTGRVEATPWDRELSPAMAAANVAVHEEAIVASSWPVFRRSPGPGSTRRPRVACGVTPPYRHGATGMGGRCRGRWRATPGAGRWDAA